MTISLAYCGNKDIRVNAAYGVWNAGLSFFCCSPRCGLPIFPRLSRGGTPHFVSRARRIEVHVPTCRHVVGEQGAAKSPSRSGSATKLAIISGRLPVPDTLMAIAAQDDLAFKDLGREAIAERATRAPMAGCPGDEEDCVDAYRSMDDEQRDRQPLTVGGRTRPYAFHFGTRTRARDAERNNNVKPSIVVLSGRAEAGTEYGAISITTEADPFPITLCIPGSYASVKRYLGEIWNELRFMGPAMVTLYWLGHPPENQRLVLPEIDGEHQFALRINYLADPD